MKLNSFALFLFTLTGFAPVAFVYALVWLEEGALNGFLLCMVLGAVGVVGCMILVWYMKKHLQSMSYVAQEVETADNEILGFVLIYMFPLITREYSTENWWAWVLVVGIVCWVVAKSYGNQFNPVLAILGWHFFKVKDRQGRSFVLITKKKMYEPNETLTVVKMADYVLLDKNVI